MTASPQCSLVPDVTGGEGGASSEPVPLTTAQARFLRFFLQGPPDRALWMRGERRLSVVAEPFAYLDGATHLLVYRVGQGEGRTLRGEAVDRTRVSVGDLKALEPYWAEPVRCLNERGRAAAKAGVPKRLQVSAFRQTDEEKARLVEAAARAGVKPSVLAGEVVAAWLAALPPITEAKE